MKNYRKNGAFTLVELLVVVLVLGILAATIIPQFWSFTQDAKVGKALADIATYDTALEVFRLRMDRYPTTAEGLRALVEPPADGADKWRERLVRKLRPDPWGNDYVYRSPSLNGSDPYDLWSRGADGKDGGEGMNTDITNAERTE